jgi:hypothetical protein
MVRSTMTEVDAQASPAQLARRLFTGPECWGWHGGDAAVTAAAPTLPGAAGWVEARPPDRNALGRALTRAIVGLVVQAVLTAAIVAMLGVIRYFADATFPRWHLFDPHSLELPAQNPARGVYVGVLVLLGILALRLLWMLVRVVAAITRLSLADGQQRRWLENEERRYLAAWQASNATIASGGNPVAPPQRGAVAPALTPLHPISAITDVCVVGGDSVGWASLLTTAGLSVLATGRSIVVVDLTGTAATTTGASGGADRASSVAEGLLWSAGANGLMTHELVLGADGATLPALSFTAHTMLGACVAVRLDDAAGRTDPGRTLPQRAANRLAEALVEAQAVGAPVPDLLIVAGVERVDAETVTALRERAKRLRVRLMTLSRSATGHLGWASEPGNSAIIMRLPDNQGAHAAAEFIVGLDQSAVDATAARVMRLESTELIAVEVVEGGRRATVADCNPQLATRI